MHIYKYCQKLVAFMKQRKHNTANEIHLLGENKMSQARVLNDKELNLLLLFISTRKYGYRDRAMVLMTFYAGTRIGETAYITVGDILAKDGTIRDEIRLSADQTKGSAGRTVTISDKLRKELMLYLQTRFNTKQLSTITNTDVMNKPLFFTQKREGFNNNTAAYHMHMLYRAAGLSDVSSHSGRRTFATKISANGCALKTLMQLLGHKQAQTTMRYVDVTADMKHAAVNLL